MLVLSMSAHSCEDHGCGNRFLTLVLLLQRASLLQAYTTAAHIPARLSDNSSHCCTQRAVAALLARFCSDGLYGGVQHSIDSIQIFTRL